MKPDLEEILKHAQQLLQKGSNEEAQMLLAEVIRFDPANRAAMMMLAGSYFATEQFDLAADIFSQLVELVPGDGKASIALFNALWKQGKQDQAFAEIKRFIENADKTRERATIEQYMKIIEQFKR